MGGPFDPRPPPLIGCSRVKYTTVHTHPTQEESYSGGTSVEFYTNVTAVTICQYGSNVSVSSIVNW